MTDEKEVTVTDETTQTTTLEAAVDRVRAEYRLAPSAPWQLMGRLRMEVAGNRVDLAFIPAKDEEGDD